MQKYRADHAEKAPDGSIAWYSDWMGGPSLAKVDNCRLDNMAGAMRRTVYITGEPDTWFSIPAVCSLAGVRVKGYVTGDDDGNKIFRHTYY
jgi:hypothetical protein